MAKNVFAVVLTEEQAKGAALLRESYPGCYEIAENIFLVADDALTGGIADAAGLSWGLVANAVIVLACGAPFLLSRDPRAERAPVS